MTQMIRITEQHVGLYISQEDLKLSYEVTLGGLHTYLIDQVEILKDKVQDLYERCYRHDTTVTGDVMLKKYSWDVFEPEITNRYYEVVKLRISIINYMSSLRRFVRVYLLDPRKYEIYRSVRQSMLRCLKSLKSSRITLVSGCGIKKWRKRLVQ